MPKKRRRRRRVINTENNGRDQGFPQQSQEKWPPSSTVSAKNCAVCFRLYDGNERRPRMLPCGHTFCTQCISKTFDGLEVSCSNCHMRHHASSSSNFPVNIDLESILQGYISSTSFMADQIMTQLTPELKNITERLGSLKIKFVNGVEGLAATSKDLSSQLEQYNAELENWKGQHQNFTAQIDDMVKSINKESEKVKDAINAELKERRRTEMALKLLQSASTESEIFQSVKNVSLFSQELERWVQMANEDFPNTVLISQSKELRRRYRPGQFKQFNAQNAEGIQSTSSSAMAQLRHDSISSPEGDESSTMTPQSRDESGSGCLYPTIQEKAYTAIEGIPPWQRDQTVQTELRDTALDINKLATSAVEVRYLLHSMMFNRSLFKDTSVLAVKEEEGGQKKWYANISFDGSQRILLSALQCHEEPVSKSGCVLLRHDDVVAMVGKRSRRIFLELGIGRRSLGKLIILLTDEGNYTSNFLHLCVGDKGHSYVGSKMLKQYGDDEVGQFIAMGDYDRNDGEGGQAVVSGVDWEEEWQRVCRRRVRCSKGLVMIGRPFFIPRAQTSQFRICIKDSSIGCALPMLGKIEEGLDMLMDACFMSCDITYARIIDCGVILQQ